MHPVLDQRRPCCTLVPRRFHAVPLSPRPPVAVAKLTLAAARRDRHALSSCEERLTNNCRVHVRLKCVEKALAAQARAVAWAREHRASGAAPNAHPVELGGREH